MALLISNAKFKNTEVEAPQVYVRLQFLAMAIGTKAAVQLLTGLDKEKALNLESVFTNLPESLMITLEEGQNQDIATIHEVVKTKLEDLGFEVTIDLA